MENQTSEETQEGTEEEYQAEPTGTQQETSEESQKETSEETVKKETSETSEAVNYEEKFKASQKEAIRLKKENDELKERPKDSKPTGKPNDIDAILEVQQATKGLEANEIAELKLRAEAKKVSLLEAREDENFVLWQTAYQKKAEDNKKTPSASNKVSVSEKPVGDITAEDIAKMNEEEKDEYWIKTGWLKPPKKSPKERLKETGK